MKLIICIFCLLVCNIVPTQSQSVKHDLELAEDSIKIENYNAALRLCKHVLTRKDDGSSTKAKNLRAKIKKCMELTEAIKELLSKGECNDAKEKWEELKKLNPDAKAFDKEIEKCKQQSRKNPAPKKIDKTIDDPINPEEGITIDEPGNIAPIDIKRDTIPGERIEDIPVKKDTDKEIEKCKQQPRIKNPAPKKIDKTIDPINSEEGITTDEPVTPNDIKRDTIDPGERIEDILVKKDTVIVAKLAGGKTQNSSSRIFKCLPFGIYQFANKEVGKGIAHLVMQGGLVVYNIMLQKKANEAHDNYVNRSYQSVQENSSWLNKYQKYQNYSVLCFFLAVGGMISLNYLDNFDACFLKHKTSIGKVTILPVPVLNHLGKPQMTVALSMNF
jgi:hypothetical protein